jgi:hypothetical protein
MRGVSGCETTLGDESEASLVSSLEYAWRLVRNSRKS